MTYRERTCLDVFGKNQRCNAIEF